MKILFLILLSFLELFAEGLSEKQIDAMINEKLLANVDGINSAIGNNLSILLTAFTIFLVFMGWSYFNKKKLIDEINLKTSKMFDEERSNTEESLKKHFNQYVKFHINRYKKVSNQAEFLRNLIFYDLNKILSTEIKENGHSNINTVFATHAERIYIIAQLTSGNDKETIKALKKFATGAHSSITKLKSFKDYLKFLEKNSDIDITLMMELDRFKNSER